MWHLKLSGGVDISEQQVSVWDNVPNDAVIEKAAFVLASMSGKFYVIELPGYQRYCIARSVSAAIAGASSEQGYCFYGQCGETVTELEVLPSGMRMKSYSIDKCQLPERCWRRGIS